MLASMHKTSANFPSSSFFSAIRMAESPEHGPVGAVHPEVQRPEVPVGPAGGPFWELQGRQSPGDRPQKAVRPRGVLLQTVPGRRHSGLRSRLQVVLNFTI